jgi:formylglycine-generating enzyme required for sulfatase activity
MSSLADLPEPRKPRQPSRYALVAACVLGIVLVGSVGVWLAGMQRTPVAPKVAPVQPSSVPVQAPAIDLQPAPSSVGPLSPERERTLKPKTSFRECAKDCPEMIVIPAGEFTMGAPATEKGSFNNESPQHKVTIAKPFAVSKFDVTFADWDACVSVGACPQVSDASFGRRTKPIINVSWDDAQQYVAWFSKRTGRPYRLLTEVEWEYAARAGTTTAYSWGDEIGTGNANCNECGSEWDNRETAPVGSFKPNEFGVYDMAGNVWQWVQDCYHGDYNGAPTDGSAWASGDCGRRVVRGGSWVDRPQFLRSALRLRFSTVFRISNLGFRIGRTLTR